MADYKAMYLKMMNAAEEAMADSGVGGSVDECRLGVIIGSGVGGINTMTAEEATTCVAIGTGKFVEFLSGDRSED